jgi:integrase
MEKSIPPKELFLFERVKRMSKRFKTPYPGVFYRKAQRVGSKGIEKVYYVVFKKAGRVFEEKVGRQFIDDMTPSRAARIRSERIEGKRLSRKEIKEKEIARKKAEENRWTLDRLYEEYMKGRPNNKARATDESRYRKYLRPAFGNTEPKEVISLDVDRLRIKLSKRLAPQTVAHVLNLICTVANFGVKKNLCEGIPFHIQKPKVHNIKTEDLTADQLNRLLEAIERDSDVQAKNLMKMALYTGMRRGELFKLRWDAIDFEKGFIHIVDPKGGPDQVIPLNDAGREVLLSHPKNESEYVFPGRNGKRRRTIAYAANRIKKRAGLPKDFRPLHGLRHVYASMLASSGKVDMYTLQKLLTHKDPKMTQRYAHLRDEALRKASNLASDIITQTLNNKTEIENFNSHQT